MRKIAVYCEKKNNTLTDTSYELISKALELKKSAKELISENNEFLIEAILPADSIDKKDVEKAFQAGCDRFVLIKDNNLDMFIQTVYLEAFMEYFYQNPSEIIIFPATPQGRIIAPRITTKLHTGLVADCTNLELILKDGELKLAPTRPTFGAELMATILSKSYPQCATIRPKVFKAVFDNPVDGDYIEYKLNYSYDEARINLLSSIKEKPQMYDYSNAKVILSAGYGLGSDKASYDKLKKISEITGAKFGATRKVVDLGYVEKEFQIGQTGAYTEADVYIAFGISGAIQHISGMKNCKKIISINSDPDAEIFKYSDYKIVADANEIINEIYSKLTS